MYKLLIGVIAASGWFQISAQAPQIIVAPKILGVGSFIHVVSNIEKSVAFYHDVLGLDLPPTSNANPFTASPEIANLYNTGGGQFRAATTVVPDGSLSVELIEFKDVEQKAVQPRIQDPGAAILVLTVRNVGLIMAQVKKSGAAVVTGGGQPVTLADDPVSGASKVQEVLLKDPDGFFVQVIQHFPSQNSPAPADVNIIDVSVAFTVSDTDQMVHALKNILSFTPQGGTFMKDKARLKLTDTSSAQIRTAMAVVPTPFFQVAFLEFKDVERKPVHSRPQDPGSSILRLNVSDADTLAKLLEAAGVKVISTGGGPVKLSSARSAILSAPDNLFIQLFQPTSGQ